jgi:hypothetical protein
MVADLSAPFLAKKEEDEEGPGKLWFTADANPSALDDDQSNGTPIAIAYCGPEKLTEGTYNLYAIAVLTILQGQGSNVLQYIETTLRA